MKGVQIQYNHECTQVQQHTTSCDRPGHGMTMLPLHDARTQNAGGFVALRKTLGLKKENQAPGARSSDRHRFYAESPNKDK